MKYKKIIPIIAWLAVIAWMTVIFLFSAQHSADSSQTSSMPAEILAKIISPNIESKSDTYRVMLLDRCQFIVRKLAHLFVYAIFGGLSYNASRYLKQLSFKSKLIFPSAMCLLYAVSDELHQFFVPGRSCQLRDVLIDFSGSMLGILALMGIFTLHKKAEK